MVYRKIIAERRLPFQSVVTQTLDEKIIAAALKNNPKEIKLVTDKNENILVDKEQHPDLYDWAVNG